MTPRPIAIIKGSLTCNRLWHVFLPDTTRCTCRALSRSGPLSLGELRPIPPRDERQIA